MMFTRFPPRSFQALDDLRQELQKVTRQSEVVQPADLTFHGDGRLSVGSDKFTFTHSGARSLFAMLRVPEQFVTRVCQAELAATVVNTLLGRVRDPVELRLRNGVVTSARLGWQPHLWHHELLDQVGDALHDPKRIEWTSEGLRIATRGRKSEEIEADDTMHFGHDLTHSEDNFHPLTANVSLFRVICANGARLFLRKHSFVGDLGRRDLADVLVGLREHVWAAVDASRPIDLLKTAAASRSTSWERTYNEVRRVVGVSTFDTHDEFLELHAQSSGYDLFNALTAAARDIGVCERQRLERLAGDFLITIGSTDGEMRTRWRREELAMALAA